MAKKTNTVVHGKKKYRLRSKINGETKNFYGESLKEAEQKRSDYLLSLDRSNYASKTFGEVFDEWFHVVLKPSVSMSTIQKYEIGYRLRIKTSPFFERLISEVLPLDIQKLYNSLDYKKAKELHKLLKHFDSYCTDSDVRAKSFMRTVKLPKEIQSDKEELVFLSDTCISKLISLSKEDPSLFIYVFALFTGMRQGEIFALTHANITRDNIEVRHSLNRVKDIDSGVTETVIGNLKTKDSRRDIPIMDELKPLLKNHIAREKAKTIRLGQSFSSNQLLFTSSTLTAMNPSNLRRKWMETLKAMNEPYIKFHGLRHTFCSLLAENNVPIKTASVLMGHSDYKTTLKVYTHVSDKGKQNAINTLNEILM